MDEAGPTPDDDAEPDVVLDETFVAGATVREGSHDQRERQARVDAEHQRLIDQARRDQAGRRSSALREIKVGRRSGRLRKLAVLMVLVALVGAAYWSTRTAKARREVISYRGDTSSPAAALAAGSVPASGINLLGGEPRAGVGERTQPLGHPAPAPATTGPYKFLALQAGTSAPVAYDPCRPIHVVLNDRTAPPGADAMVRAAFARASQLTGLQFVIDGPTTEIPSLTRPVYEPSRYPGRWAPVLVAWTDPTEIPTLAGDVAGLGGSQRVPIVGQSVYVTGIVYLDGPQLTRDLSYEQGAGRVQAVLEHEIGHLIGLAHVNDPTQVMNPVAGAVTDYGAGDQLGLEALGRGRCFPDI
jgi:hypothetical protein